MLKLFSLFLLCSCLLFANSIYDVNDKSFKEGFKAGLKFLEFQSKNDGFQSQEMQIKKPYLLIADITEMPLDAVLFLQFIANREGFETHLSQEFLSFGEYEREIDAKEHLNILANRFKIPHKALKILNNQETLITKPFLWTKAFEEILAEAKKNGILIETRIVQSAQLAKEQPKKQAKKIKQQTFTLKNAKAMSYYIQKNANPIKSASYLEHTLKDKQNFLFEKTITTEEQESFVKVKEKNLYFSTRDIEMQEAQEEEIYNAPLSSAQRAKRIKEFLLEEEELK